MAMSIFNLFFYYNLHSFAVMKCFIFYIIPWQFRQKSVALPVKPGKIKR